jgi:hypothetical protein
MGSSFRRRLPRLLLLVAACSVVASGDAASAGSITPPPLDGPFSYQLGGAYRPPAGTKIVTRDRKEPPARGRYSICYVNAFQTQPGELGWWQKHHRSLLLRRRGRAVRDPGWPGEVLLDTSTARRRAAIARVIGRWIDGCARKGFDAVEPDNLDSWTRSKGRLTKSGNRRLARRLVARAHARGLAIGQKNAAEMSASGRRLGFDFAVAESCEVYRECDVYTEAYGGNVLEVEYVDEGGAENFDAACRARGASVSINYRDRDLTTPADDSHVDRTC